MECELWLDFRWYGWSDVVCRWWRVWKDGCGLRVGKTCNDGLRCSVDVIGGKAKLQV